MLVQLKKLFPSTYGQPIVELRVTSMPSDAISLRIGVVLSGGQASGGHNVIAGIFDFLQRSCGPDSALFGFLDGPAGIFKHKYQSLTRETIQPYVNQGMKRVFHAAANKTYDTTVCVVV